jgi:P-type Ca2+ transporter type 2C
MSLVFVSLVMTELFKAFNYRSDRRSVLHRPFANRWLDLAVLWELVLLALVVELPFLERAFGTYPLSVADWLRAAVLAGSVTLVLELVKWMVRREWFGADA